MSYKKNTNAKYYEKNTTTTLRYLNEAKEVENPNEIVNWVVFNNPAAGDAVVVEYSREDEELNRDKRPVNAHYSYYGEYTSADAAGEAMDEIAGDIMFAVFVNVPAGEAYYDQVDGLSGNYKGSGRHPYTFVDEFDNEEKAQKLVAEYLADFQPDEEAAA